MNMLLFSWPPVSSNIINFVGTARKNPERNVIDCSLVQIETSGFLKALNSIF